MAKGSGNPAGNQPPSRNAKPYDVNNSFVKKVATKVTDFIPQRSWISKWFNTSQDNVDTLDVREKSDEPEFTDDVQQPPPSKRPRIRMDVIHPPGTFSIQPMGKTALNTVDPSKKQYLVQNETSEDFLEPPIAGPSGIGRLISSTPAMQADIRTVTSHRSDLNSLAPPTNNGTTNGTDDNSESSESTSGCSSLIPQINRHEGPSNLLYNSTLSNRKEHIDDKLTFTNHLQSPRSLFLDSNSRDTLSSRRPSFNASVMTNILGRASPLSSPFYSGNTTFGGANTAGLYRQGRNLFSDSSELQLKVPRRTNVEVKPSTNTTEQVDSSGMSQTAKKILEALEHFSSPITDAKKIPLRNVDNTSSSGRKRPREEVATPSARVGLRHLTRELTVPTVPDILKLRRRQKLQDTTLAARKIVSARGNPPPPVQEYHLRTENVVREKYHGKIRGKSKINLEEEETVEPVNLPNITLPISTLPNFNFMMPLTPCTLNKITTSNKDIFTFASPIKVTDAGKNLQSFNHFTFSNPINAKDSVNSSTINSSPFSKTEKAASTSTTSCTTAFMPNFIWSGSSTAPRLKEKAKDSKDSSFEPATAQELKSGSVMDVLCPKMNKIESNLMVQPNTGFTFETAPTDKIGTFVSDTNVKGAIGTKSSNSIDSATNSLSNWECSECLIRNNSSDIQCIACKVPRSDPNDKINDKDNNDKVSAPLSTDTVVKTKPVVDDCFGSQFKLSANQWECTACYVKNQQNDVKCIACSASKPGSKSAMQTTSAKPINFDIIKYKPPEGSWECSGCLLRNAANVITCPCCNTSKPTLIKPITKTDTGAVPSAQKSTSVGNENTPSTTGNSDLMNKFKPSKDSWECPGCFVRNNGTVTSCPCCNTVKPDSVGGASKTEQTSKTNGFGDMFKKPVGAWNCDSCLLQNDAKHTECIACQAPKPGTAKSNESTSSTGSTLQFKFGAPSGTGGFKFGIDKADSQSKSDSASPLNGFKFGQNTTQQNSGAAQFTFGIPKDENKAANESSTTSNSATASGSTGFQFNVKSSERSDGKSNQESKPKDTSFGVSRSDGLTMTNEKQSASIVSGTALILPPFTFDAQKAVFNQPASSNQTQEKPSHVSVAIESSKPTVGSDNTAPTSTSGALPSLLKRSDAKPNPIFSFNVPSSTSAASNNISNTTTSIITTTSTTTTCLPTFAQPSLTFSNSKTVPQTAKPQIPAFGQVPTSTPALSTNLSFGGNKIAETTSAPLSGKSAVSDTSATSLTFPIVSSSTSLFNSNEPSKSPIAFRQTDKPSAFASTSGKPSGFAMPENKIPITGFGNNTENKPIFGTQETKLPVFGNGEKTASVFSSTGQTPTVTPLPTFGATSNATPLTFGPSSGSTFGNNTGTPAFGSTTTPTMFSVTKTNENNTSANPPPLFTFGSNQSAQQPASGGFNFSANVNPPESAAKQPLFVFGANAQSAPQTNNMFGSDGFGNPTPTNTASFTFNAPKQQESAPPTFGQTAVAPPMFGANSQTQVTSSFSSTPSSSAGFNFGSTVPPVAPSGGFNFGGMPSTSTPTGGFNFNPPGSTPAVAFDPNSRPSFNFTKGSAPTTFNAPPQSAAASRKIKKAFRRCR